MLHIFPVFFIWYLTHHEHRDDHTQKNFGNESTFEFVLSFNTSVGQTRATTKLLPYLIYQKSLSKMLTGLVTIKKKTTNH